jgi:hypothetical protein
MNKLEDECKGKSGMPCVIARLQFLNNYSCWISKESQEKRWGRINRHLWRIWALYQGGDCFLAGFNGATPHQRLWPFQSMGKHSLPSYRDSGTAAILPPSGLWLGPRSGPMK